MNTFQTMSHESSGLCWCGPDNHGPAIECAPIWASSITVEALEDAHRHGYATPISGDDTAVMRHYAEAPC